MGASEKDNKTLMCLNNDSRIINQGDRPCSIFVEKITLNGGKASRWARNVCKKVQILIKLDCVVNRMKCRCGIFSCQIRHACNTNRLIWLDLVSLMPNVRMTVNRWRPFELR